MSHSLPNTPSPLTHVDAQGQAHMVDVGAKASTHRVAVATGRIQMLPSTLELVQAGTAKKGDVLGIARIARALCLESFNRARSIGQRICLAGWLLGHSLRADQCRHHAR